MATIKESLMVAQPMPPEARTKDAEDLRELEELEVQIKRKGKEA